MDHAGKGQPHTAAEQGKRPMTNPFAVLGLPEVFDLPAATIEAAYFEHSKVSHPDRFASAPASERIAALSRSGDINAAYKTLRKETSRAEALLGLRGVVIGDHERLDPTFLMEILELREELAIAKSKGQLELVESLQATMLARRNAVVAKLGPGFATAAATVGSEQAFAHQLLKQHLIELRYLDRYLEECDSALLAE